MYFPSITLCGIWIFHHSLYTVSVMSINHYILSLWVFHQSLHAHLNFPSITLPGIWIFHQSPHAHLNFPSITLLGIWIFPQSLYSASEFSINHSTRIWIYPQSLYSASEFSINHSTHIWIFHQSLWHLNFLSITLLGIWIIPQSLYSASEFSINNSLQHLYFTLVTLHQGWALRSFFISVRYVLFCSKKRTFFSILFLSFWWLMKPKRMFRSFPFFSKERKRTQRTFRSF